MNKKIAMVIHGGLGDNLSFIKKHYKDYELGLEEAIRAGYQILQKSGSAIDAVVEAVRLLEDNALFNAGRGSALNGKGFVEMDASIMDGKTLNAGAVSAITHVKNPIILAKNILQKTPHVLLSGKGALDFAKEIGLTLEKKSYFITPHQYEKYLKFKEATESRHNTNLKRTSQKKIKTKTHGTVGAVALDEKGNLVAGTSTGGLKNSMPGRVGDSCIIGAGCYANNQSCAISCTGEGEKLIRNVVAHSISMVYQFKKVTIQKACDEVIFKQKFYVPGDMGLIALDHKGNIGMSFNTPTLLRAWIDTKGKLFIKV